MIKMHEDTEQIPEAFLYQCWRPGLHCSYASIHEDHRPDDKWTRVFRHNLWFIKNGGVSQELIDGEWVDVTESPKIPQFPPYVIGHTEREGYSQLRVDDTMMMDWIEKHPSIIITQTEHGVRITLDDLEGHGKTLREAIGIVILKQEELRVKADHPSQPILSTAPYHGNYF